MATYRVVDADQLEADLTSVADTIRTKGGTSADLAWPEGYKAAVEAIETGGGASSEDGVITRSVLSYENNRVTSVGMYTFAWCSKLQTVSLPNAETLSSYAFLECGVLENVNIPKVTQLSTQAFQYNYKLKQIRLPAVERIMNYVFRGDSVFDTLVLPNTNTVCSLNNSNALNGTPIASGTGYIYVPSALVDSYKAATNWSTYADQFRALESYTVDGTITGELDPTKTGT